MFSILVIDDEPNNFDVIETFLVNEKYRLYYASSGQDAFQSLDLFKPDLILLDINMFFGIWVCIHATIIV